jgi:hypothetical protein
MRKSVLLTAFIFLFSVSFRLLQAQPSIPVDPLTGKLSLSIPIWQMSEGELSVPISIYYQGGGVRVEQSEGTAGMSWNLSAGGVIARDLRGLPDDYLGSGTDVRKGWLYNGNAAAIQNFVSAADYNLSICTDEALDYNFINGLYSTGNDTEPDVFNFYAPGLSGQFVFGSDGLPKLIPYQDINVTVTRQGGTGPIEQVVITNNVGVAYTFSVKETTTRKAYRENVQIMVTHFLRDYDYYGAPVSYTTAWQLTKITSPAGAEISFTYTGDEQVNSNRKVTIINEQGASTDLYTISEQTIPQKVTFINTDANVAQLTWGQSRIERVLVTDNQSNEVKQFDFVYDFINDYRASSLYEGRSFLKEIRQQENCITFPSYSFTYEGVDFNNHTTVLSFKDKNFQDLWGYYNGTSTTRTPDIYVYNAQVDAERFRLNLIPNQTPSQTLAGANRSVNAAVIAAGAITYINYPTGSFAQIEYEPNQYYDATAAASYPGGGIRVKKVTLAQGEKGTESIVTDYQYLANDGQTSGRLLYRPVFAFYDGTSIVRSPNNLAPESGLYYSQTTIKQTSKGKTVYAFTTPALYATTAFSDWSATNSKVVRPAPPQGQPCYSLGNQISGYYQFPFAPNTNYDFERGLLSSVKDYAEDGTLVREKLYSYQRLATPLITIKGLSFEKLPNTIVFGHYTILANLNKVTQTETLRISDDIVPVNKFETITTYKYNPTHNLLDTLLTTNSDGVIHKTKYRYARDFVITNPNTSNIETVALKALNDNNRHGELVETLQYRKDGASQTFIGAALSLFKDFGAGKVLPQRAFVFPTNTTYTTTAVSGSPQSLTYNTAYILTNTIQSYTNLGMPQSSLDNHKIKTGVHYGYSGTTPLVALTNAYAEEAVYSGFDTSNSFPISFSGGTFVPGWIGDYALSINQTDVLTSSNLIQKGGNKYRFSCWVKSSAAPVITFKAKNGATVQSSGTVTYNTLQSNQWQYLEAELNTTSVSSLFTLEVVTSASCELDEIRFYPASAVMSTKAIKPLVGVIAETNDKGLSTFQEYDELDRVKYIKNQDKDIVQIHDYRFKAQTVVPLNSEFTENIPFGGAAAGQQIQFMAPTNCSSVSYQWKIDNINVSTASSLDYSFATPGSHTVELITSSTEGSVTTKRTICVRPAPVISLTNTGTLQIYECSQEFVRTVTATIGSCTASQGVSYQWFYRLASMPTFQSLPGNNNSLTFNLSTLGWDSIYIKCVATGSCIISNANTDACNGSYEFSSIEQSMLFTYVDQGTCL